MSYSRHLQRARLSDLLEDREIPFRASAQLSIIENSIVFAAETNIYSRPTGVANATPISTVGDALETVASLQCEYLNEDPVIITDLSGQIRSSCTGEVTCSPGVATPVRVSCRALGSTGHETCPTATECFSTPDTLLIRSAN